MRRPSSRRLLGIIVFLGMFFLNGCRSAAPVLSGQWLTDLARQSGLIEAQEGWQEAYPALKQWGIRSEMLKSEEILTKERAAVILSDWLQCESEETILINDLQETEYAEEIRTVVGLKLFELDSEDCFHPQQPLLAKEATEILEKFIFMINSDSADEHFDLELKDGYEFISIEPYQFDPLSFKALIDPVNQPEKGALVEFEWDTRQYYFKVGEIEDGITQFEPIDSNLIEHLDIQGPLQLDWDEAEFVPAEMESPLVYQQQEDEQLELLFASAYIREFKAGDFTVRLNYTTSSISVYAFKKTNLNANFFVQLDITGIKPSFKYSGGLTYIDHAYTKVSFKLSVASGLKKGNYRQLFLSPEKIDPSDWLKTLREGWTNKRAEVDTIIPIGELKIPLAAFPQLTFNIQLQLRVYLNGKMELLYTVENEMGMEVRNNQLRKISNQEYDLDFLFQATTGVTAKVTAAAALFQQSLLDIALEAGLRAQISSTLHLLESEETIEEELIPYDVLAELTADEGGILLCADLNAWWLANLELNSGKTLAGKLGLGKTFPLLNRSNASLFSGGARHMENLQFVDACTRTKKAIPLPTLAANTSRIMLESYSLLLQIGESRYLAIRGLPEGVGKDDLIFSSSHPEIVRVDEKGLLTANAAGVSSITIEDINHTYSVQCSVLVKER